MKTLRDRNFYGVSSFLCHFMMPKLYRDLLYSSKESLLLVKPECMLFVSNCLSCNKNGKNLVDFVVLLC
jgi:hypothetical protein